MATISEVGNNVTFILQVRKTKHSPEVPWSVRGTARIATQKDGSRPICLAILLTQAEIQLAGRKGQTEPATPQQGVTQS